MGYEVTMYVVEPVSPAEYEFVKHCNRWANIFNGKLAYGADRNTALKLTGQEKKVKKKCASKVAMVELCKIGAYPEAVKAEYYFYDLDGNTPVIEDHYDEELRQLSVPEMISFIKGQKNDYRRFTTALAVLESLGEDYRNPVVLLFGH